MRSKPASASRILEGAPRALARAALLALALAASAAFLGCGQPLPVAVSRVWVAGKGMPAFDPDGPPDALRWSLERLLSHGLVEEDSAGHVVAAAAERFEVSDDGRVYTFHLPARIAYSGGSPCTSADFAAALRAGLGRADHATRDYLLQAVVGLDRVRAGKPLPTLGIETPDARTLILRLARPDSTLLRRLALPGVSSPWNDRGAGTWKAKQGLGPYETVSVDGERQLTLVRRGKANGPDTIRVRFAIGAPRVRTLLRNGGADLVWPIPPGLLDEPLPASYRSHNSLGFPARHLLLVMRMDLPPTSKLEARQVLAHGLNTPAILRSLGPEGREVRNWFPGAERVQLPRLDGDEVRRWMAQGKLGRSFHVNLTYDADGAGAAVARTMQGDWARQGIYADLLPRRGERATREILLGLAHVVLVEAQALTRDPASQFAPLVLPMRGPAVGAFRTGWRTRAFDSWIAPGTVPGNLIPIIGVSEVQRSLIEERVAVPLAELPWIWIEREGRPAAIHPHFGPRITISAGALAR